MGDGGDHLRPREPSRLVEDLYKAAAGVPKEWADMLRRYELGDGITIGCMEGRA